LAKVIGHVFIEAEVITESSPPLNEEGASPERPARNVRLNRIIFIAVMVALVVGAILFAVVRAKTRAGKPAAQPSITNFSATRTFRLNGTTEAVRMRAVLAPVLAGQYVATLTITKMATAGTHVKQGDLLAEFDRQSQLRDSIDKQAAYDGLVSQVAGEQAKENAARAKDETEIKQAEDNLSKAQLEMQKVEIVSRIDAEKAQEDLEEAQATLKQLRETFDLKRTAARATIGILEIQRDRTRQIMLHARSDAALMQVRAPLDGVVVLNTIWKQGRMGEVQEGDQLRPGIPFMQVVDPSLMEVRVLANQEDFLNLRPAQLAQIHLDAYPELTFPGRLEEMAPIGRNGSFSPTLRTFAVVFSIAGQDAKLMPDLSASVDVELPGNNSPQEAPR
jgi:HlyD family secretion protein